MARSSAMPRGGKGCGPCHKDGLPRLPLSLKTDRKGPESFFANPIVAGAEGPEKSRSDKKALDGSISARKRNRYLDAPLSIMRGKTRMPLMRPEAAINWPRRRASVPRRALLRRGIFDLMLLRLRAPEAGNGSAPSAWGKKDPRHNGGGKMCRGYRMRLFKWGPWRRMQMVTPRS